MSHLHTPDRTTKPRSKKCGPGLRGLFEEVLLTRIVLSEENVCPPPVWSDLSKIFALVWHWKWGQDHQNLIGSCPCLNNIAVQVWSKYIHSFWRYGAEKTFFNNLSPSVTLKMESRSPKSNQFFFLSQQYSCASLVKIHSVLHVLGCRQAIFQQSKPLCDLENGVMVIKIQSVLFHVTTI